MYSKPAASLSSALLARKGHARPAMRPQGFVSMAPQQAVHDDLGWNDMGEENSPQAAPPAVVEPLAMGKPLLLTELAPEPEPVEPPVLRQRAELDERISKPAAPAPAPVEVPAPLERVVSEIVAGKSKAAFTLRLDFDRHLRLRLASAVRHQSAQLLVTEALDAFLETLTDVDALARQLSGREGRD